MIRTVSRILVTTVLFSWLLVSPLCAAARSATDRPNFVIVFTDDQGYQDLGCFGSPDIL